MRKIFALVVLLTGVISCQPDEPALPSDKSISEFRFLMANNAGLSADVTGVIDGEQIYITVPAGTSITALKPTIVHTGNTISPESGAPKNFTTAVEYTVTAKDRSTKKYTVSVTVLPAVLSSDKMITAFAFLKEDNPTLSEDATGTIIGQTIFFTLPAGTNVTALKPSIVHTGHTTSPAAKVANNFTEPATYTVTAEDGSTEAYTVTVTLAAAGPVVYVVGGERFSGTSYARLWTNGTGTNLTNGAYNAGATSVFVSGNTVYAVGWEHIGDYYAASWAVENGVLTPGLNETGYLGAANSIFVSDDKDVYIAGNENQGAGTGVIAKVWKNGTPTPLTSKSGNAYSVFVAGNDVYVAGTEWNEIASVIKVWKNGTPTTLTPENERAEARAVFVAGGVVYVAGMKSAGSDYVIHLWKDGVPEIINEGSPNSWVTSMFVSGGDVYLTGWEVNGSETCATVWKNGVPTFLSASRSSAHSVYVHNGDVYVAGIQRDESGDEMAILWKNGVATTLAAKGFALGVMVK